MTNTPHLSPAGHILVIGDTSCDVLIKAPTPGSKETTEPELVAGGTAGNTAAALARLGLHSKLVTELGDDYYGRYVHKLLEASGVDTEQTHIFPGYPTTQVIILLDEQDSPAADWPIADPALFTLVKKQHITEELVAGASWIHTSGTSAMYENARAVMLHTIDLACALKTRLSFDINLRLHREVGTPAGIQSIHHAIQNADVVFGSEDEWLFLAGVQNRFEAARKLLSRRDQIAVIRNGPEGCIGIQKETSIHSPAFRVPVRDALGAGDTFDAGFILAQLEKRELNECLRWGNGTAALKLMQVGGQRGGPTRQQLLNFLDSKPELLE